MAPGPPPTSTHPSLHRRRLLTPKAQNSGPIRRQSHITGTRGHCLVQPRKILASQRARARPRKPLEAPLPGDCTGMAPNVSALVPSTGRVESRPCPGYFKLDTPASPLLSGIRATCRGPGTADLAVANYP